ncbi:hypothetical protein O9G_005420 [Rozella allomycis CSF55]|uniref:Uncharacterized protein n=1 Tax=Rozella allomycis (strain CSF55) TaxID=988480 RepID=A0A075ARS4_ROZAC|nr:hypothetical protein O9G_005420 [Rozella allomycis CSF55]|eukprot:EPZ32943.1 hypothetical protein O9G_005420 [Rozella allomycis CSF55]
MVRYEDVFLLFQSFESNPSFIDSLINKISKFASSNQLKEKDAKPWAILAKPKPNEQAKSLPIESIQKAIRRNLLRHLQTISVVIKDSSKEKIDNGRFSIGRLMLVDVFYQSIRDENVLMADALDKIDDQVIQSPQPKGSRGHCLLILNSIRLHAELQPTSDYTYITLNSHNLYVSFKPTLLKLTEQQLATLRPSSDKNKSITPFVTPASPTKKLEDFNEKGFINDAALLGFYPDTSQNAEASPRRMSLPSLALEMALSPATPSTDASFNFPSKKKKRSRKSKRNTISHVDVSIDGKLTAQ